MNCVLPQNGMRFAAKWNAFCRKMEGVLPQNGKLFGPKWNVFWPKMECVLAQNGMCFGPKCNTIIRLTPWLCVYARLKERFHFQQSMTNDLQLWGQACSPLPYTLESNKQVLFLSVVFFGKICRLFSKIFVTLHPLLSEQYCYNKYILWISLC